MDTYASEATSFASPGDKTFTNSLSPKALSSPSWKTEYKNPFSDTESLKEPEMLVDNSPRDEERDVPAPLPMFRPNRRRGLDVELGGLDTLTEVNLTAHNMNVSNVSNVNPLLHNFTSPIG